jgi:hypothetical protein
MHADEAFRLAHTLALSIGAEVAADEVVRRGALARDGGKGSGPQGGSRRPASPREG